MDRRRGIPGANRHDKVLLEPTLDSVVVPRPKPSEAARQHLGLHRWYDYDTSREAAASRATRSTSRCPAGSSGLSRTRIAAGRDGVVERTHSCLNRSRRLLVRWEKKAENYRVMLHLACAQLIFGKLDRLLVAVTEQPIRSVSGLAG